MDENFRRNRDDWDDDDERRNYDQASTERFYEANQIGYGGQTARDYGGPSVRDDGRDYGKSRRRGDRYDTEDDSDEQYNRERGRYSRGREEDDRWTKARWREPYERPTGETDSRGRSRSTNYSPQYGYDTDYGRRSGYSYTEGNRGDYGARDEWGSRNRLSSTSEAYSHDYQGDEYGQRRDFREERRGPYSGRGPKGWQRSDERIREDVSEILARRSDIDPGDVEVKVNNGEVTLEGSVQDRWMKRQMEDVVYSVFGVQEVHNRTRITPGSSTQRGGGTKKRDKSTNANNEQSGTEKSAANKTQKANNSSSN